MLADTPDPPYTAVIFTSVRGPHDDGYAETSERMKELAAAQPGYLGMESVPGITVSYWATEDDARGWKRVAEHVEAQRRGIGQWYERYRVRIATVHRAYGKD